MSAEPLPRAATGDRLRTTTTIVAAYVGNNVTAAEQIAEVVRAVYRTLTSVGQLSKPEAEALKPAVPIKKSITPDHLVCLEADCNAPPPGLHVLPL